MNGISRRDFMKKAGLMLAGASFAGLSGFAEGSIAEAQPESGVRQVELALADKAHGAAHRGPDCLCRVRPFYMHLLCFFQPKQGFPLILP